MLIISDDEIRKHLSMADTISLMRTLFADLAEGRAELPDRTVIELENKHDSVLFMPGYLPRINGLGIKVISIFPTNLKRNLPTASAKILLLDTVTGRSLALLDGGYITAMRTAAVSAVAADILARKNADTLGIFGAGAQGRSHIEALIHVRPLRNIIIYDIDPVRAEELINRLPAEWKRKADFKTATASDELVTDCAIIMTTTTSGSPVFSGKKLQPGTHVGAVGSYKPHIREIDDDAIQRMRIFVDRRADALEEAGDLIIPLKSGLITEKAIVGELSDLISGTIKGRTGPDDITFFKSVGLAIEDIIVAHHVYGCVRG